VLPDRNPVEYIERVAQLVPVHRLYFSLAANRLIQQDRRREGIN
jgi:hypothetical protein